MLFDPQIIVNIVMDRFSTESFGVVVGIEDREHLIVTLFIYAENDIDLIRREINNGHNPAQ